MIKKMIIFIIIIINFITLTGCWSYTELNDILIVTGACIDKNVEDNTYHLTIEVVDVSSSGKDGAVQSKLIETNGTTLFDAVRNSLELNAFKLYWSNCEIIIISQDIAKEGITPVLDFLLRNQEIRGSIQVLVSKEATAKGIINKKTIASTFVSYEIDKLLHNHQIHLSTASGIQLNKLYNMLASNTTSLVLPCINSVENNEEKIIKIDGNAVFDKDRLIGYLSPDETKSFLFATNNVIGGLLAGRIEQQFKDDYSLEILGNKSKISYKKENDILMFKISLETQVAIVELQTKTDYTEVEAREILIKHAEDKLQKNVEEVIKKVQKEYGVDIFGFGEYIKKHDYNVWVQYKNNWNETFKNVKVDVTSKIDITNSNMIRKPIKVGE